MKQKQNTILNESYQGPIPLASPILSRSNKSHDSSYSNSPSIEDIPGILKNISEPVLTVPCTVTDSKVPTKSILKVDKVENVLSAPTQQEATVYEIASSSSSSEDLAPAARSFSDVIIDPLPGQGRRSAPEVRNYKSHSQRWSRKIAEC